MNKFTVWTPYVIWILITLLTIELEIFNTYNEMFLYLLISFILAFGYEVHRNKNKGINELDYNLKTYVTINTVNVLYGIPLIYILLVLFFSTLRFPTDDINVIQSNSNVLSKPKIYMITGYLAIWFCYNNILIKPVSFLYLFWYVYSLLLLFIPTFICIFLMII